MLSEAAPLFNMSSRDGLCPGTQAANITYHGASLFVDPSLCENNSRLASSVQLAQVGTTEITNLSKSIRATFLVEQNYSLGVRVASGRMRAICLINRPLQQQRPLDRVSTLTTSVFIRSASFIEEIIPPISNVFCILLVHQ